MPGTHDPSLIPVVDLFAGPGGLGEGFAAWQRPGRGRPFRIALSVEAHAKAHATLEIRAFFRQFGEGKAPEVYYKFLRGAISREEMFARHPADADAAMSEARHGTLGGDDLPPERLRQWVLGALGSAEAWVLIGGPPCQAYSVAGRSRNRGKEGYRIESDHRHGLYREYLRILASHRPPVFVMENVPGLLSTTVNSERLFERILNDLADPGRAIGERSGARYALVPAAGPPEGELFPSEELSRFIVRCEEHGVPQRRHRLILLGIRKDIAAGSPPRLERRPQVPVRRVLDGLPRLRSGVSIRGTIKEGGLEMWRDALLDALDKDWLRRAGAQHGTELQDRIVRFVVSAQQPEFDLGGEFVAGKVRCDYAAERAWFLDNRLGGICNHAARKHMKSDLHRYLFVAAYGAVFGRSPRLGDFPVRLRPDHLNVEDALKSGNFNDRFRVQVADQPATTITSHIAKDGHYYIHYDAGQCRALTVREAARIQTFPDNYFFWGPRTSQFTQVGNAVPPLMARDLAGVVFEVLRAAGLA